MKPALGIGHLSVVLLAIAMSVPGTGASAQQQLPFREESAGGIQAGPLSVQGAFVGTPIVVNEAFTTQHENGPPSAAFRIIVPKGEGMRFMAGGKKSGVPELLRLALPSKDGTQAVEILRFVNLYMGEGPPQARLAEAAKLLRDKAFSLVTATYEKAALLDLYATKIGGYDAVALHATMAKPGTGEVYFVKLAAILHPRLNGVMAFLMADSRLSEVKAADDLRSKGVGMRIIHSLKFE